MTPARQVRRRHAFGQGLCPGFVVCLVAFQSFDFFRRLVEIAGFGDDGGDLPDERFLERRAQGGQLRGVGGGEVRGLRTEDRALAALAS